MTAPPPHLPLDGTPAPVSGYLDYIFEQGRIGIVAVHLTETDARFFRATASCAIISAVSVLALYAYLLSHVAFPGKGERLERARSIKTFLSNDLGCYMTLLMATDFVANIASMFSLHWAASYAVYGGTLCNVQGSIVQFTFLLNSMGNAALAVTTFVLLVPKWRTPTWVKFVVVPSLLGLSALLTGLGPATKTDSVSFFGPTRGACWMNLGSSSFQLWFLAAPVYTFCVIGLMLIIYFTIFIHLSGWRFLNRAPSTIPGQPIEEQVTSRNVRSAARRMLYFPLAWTVCSTPLLVTLLIAQVQGVILSVSVDMGVSAFQQLFGLVNVLVFVVTRRSLLVSHSSSRTQSNSVKMSVVKRTIRSEPYDSLADLHAHPMKPGMSEGAFGESSESLERKTTSSYQY